MRRTITVLLAAACLALAGCSSSDDGKADSKPTASESVPASDSEACKELLEENYAAGRDRNVSGSPECQGLSTGEYEILVKEVLTGHMDDFLDDAEDQVMYDAAWDGLDAESQATMCELMDESGPAAVGDLLGEKVTDPSVDTTAMAEYLHAEKC